MTETADQGEKKRRPWWRWIIRLLAGLLLLLLTLSALTLLPPVQQWLADQGSAYLSRRFQTRIELGSIRLVFPKYVQVEDLYVEDQQADTLLFLGRLRVDVDLLSLIGKRVNIAELQVRNVHLDAHPLDSVMNYAFLIPPPDTTGTNEREEPASGSGWALTLHHSDIRLERIRARFEGLGGAPLYDLDLGLLRLLTREADLRQMAFSLWGVTLERTRLDMRLPEPQVTEVEDAPAPIPLDLKVARINLRDLAYQLSMSTLELSSGLEEAILEGGELALGSAGLQMGASGFRLSSGRCRFDQPGTPLTAGFDPAHFALTGIETRIEDFSYDDLKIRGAVRTLSGREEKGFRLRDLATLAYFDPDSVSLEDLTLVTDRSQIRAPLARAGSFSEALWVDLDLQSSQLYPGEALYFLPGLDSLLAPWRDYPLACSARAKGDLDALKIQSLGIAGQGFELALHGTMEQLDRYPDFSAALDLERLYRDATGPYLPLDSTLREWFPQSIAASGTLDRQAADIRANLRVQATAPGTPAPLQLHLSAVGQHWLDSLRSRWSARVDALQLPGQTLAWAARKAGVDSSQVLPKAIAGKLEGQGTLDSIGGSWQLDIVGFDNEPARLVGSGTVHQPGDNSQMRLEARLDSLQIAPADLLAYLPDSLLPHPFRWPRVLARGDFSSRKDQMQGRLQLQTSAGTVSMSGLMDQGKYIATLDLDTFQLLALVDSLAYDTLLGKPLSPFKLDLNLAGEGWDPDSNMVADLNASFLPLDTALGWREGTFLEAAVRPGEMRVQSWSAEPGLDFTFDWTGILRPDLTGQGKLALVLDTLDLQRLLLSNRPAEAAFSLRSTGGMDDEKKFDFELQLKDGYLFYDTTYVRLDRLESKGLLTREQDHLSLDSDLAKVSLDGLVHWETILDDLQEFGASFYRPEDRAKPKLQHPQDSFHLRLQVMEPEFFTSGILPGLTRLSPLDLNLGYYPEIGEANLSLRLPELEYRGARLDSLLFNADTPGDSLHYRVTFDELSYLDVFALENLGFRGNLYARAAQVVMEQVDSAGSRRFDLGFRFQLGEKELRVRVQDTLVLDYDPWVSQKQSVLELGRGTVNLDELIYTHEEERIRVYSPGLNTLAVRFEDFPLRVLSKLLKSDDLLGGGLNGEVEVKDLFGEPQPKIGLRIEQLSLLDAPMGDLQLELTPRENLQLDSRLRLFGSGNDLRVEGRIRPRDSSRQLALRADLRAFNLELAETFSGGSLREVEGRLVGGVDIEGPFSRPDLNGDLRFLEAAVRPAFTNVKLKLDPQPIRLKGKEIAFSDWFLEDSLGNRATLSLRAGLKEEEWMMEGRIRAEDFLTLNTQARHNPVYYGTLFLDVDTEFSTRQQEVVVNSDIRTDPRSRLTFVNVNTREHELDTGEGVVEFVGPAEPRKRRRKTLQEAGTEVASQIFDLNLNLAIREGFTGKVVVDTITGDFFEGKGSGNLTLRAQSKQPLSLTGYLEMMDGVYNFTYSEVIRRKFELERGSKVTWTGNPLEPELDLVATYTTRAAPYPLVAPRAASGQELDRYFRKEVFIAKLIISGELDETRINSQVEYPEIPANTKDPKIVRAVEDLQRDEAAMSQQAYSLILFNSFMNTAGPGQGVGVANVQQGLNQLLTRQLNLLAGQYINFVEIDFGLETNTSGDLLSFEDTDFRVTLRKRFLEGRLVVSVDGVAGKREIRQESRNNFQTYLDNIKVEYSLNKKGTLRIKLFNQQDRSDVLARDAVTLGGALVFSRSFKQLILVELKGREGVQKLN